ncbi:DEAD/DEAH box helicase [Furfurilactobacillus siliginis]|uniref:DNA/RNA helicase n=1 Tax=Furfurilactobacillus siliginis TaxID=348151 RepID=A0A0R2L4I5_9LACO|nr:DEAD/DEAH box helicase family protein [Furfurilactobacillus siliginis]KRN96590.1 helicase domain-containing protein [Furfurilactobacillus siliginis]GEK29073.1 DNA/RNA helicase [Furfurilactobacillus siliginis]
MLNDYLFGRQLTPAQLTDEIDLTDTRIVQRPGMLRDGAKIICQRCQTHYRQRAVRVPAGGWYCPACIALGRVTSREALFTIPEPNAFSETKQPLTWTGELTRLQDQCADEVATVFAEKRRHLLWAVTGAGKTEMLFKGLAQALAAGQRIAVASPRVDVCIELFPRLQQAFADTSMVLLHGQQDEPYRYCQLTVCTTHQLFRFYHAFDVLVVDEVDAFPFAQDKTLQVAVKQALKPQAACLYLTATPGKQLLRQVKQQKLTVSYLPLRFHGHLLPMIKIKLAFSWRRQLQHKRLPMQIQQQISHRLRMKQRFLLFVPHVAQLDQVAAALKKVGIAAFATVHAADPERLQKVAAMRNGDIQFLVTTTILERGVTFSGIDVLVLGADDPVFSSAALVQIAGRAGRSQERPTGHVIMWAAQKTHILQQARRQIIFLNMKARRLPEWQSVDDVKK